MGRPRDPVTRLAANLMQVESWVRKGKLNRARDMLEGCKNIYLPAVPASQRAPWVKKVQQLDASLPNSTWAHNSDLPIGGPSPSTILKGTPAEPSTGDDHGIVARPNPLWERVGRALDDRRTDFAVLTTGALSARCDFVATESGVQLWVTIRNPISQVWDAVDRGTAAEPYGIAPGTRSLAPAGEALTKSPGWLLVWMFSSVLDARVALRFELMTSRSDVPTLTVYRHPQLETAAFDREVERLGSRAYRPGYGSQKFAITSCTKCGQPLSDPSSVKLGIGPDCLKYFDPKVLVAARRWKPTSVRALGRSQTEYLGDVWGEW